MSKLYDTYLQIKNTNESDNTLLLFKSGIFYILLDEDAKIASNLLHLKLTPLNNTIMKCGFPINSLDKYSNVLKLTTYNFRIIDTSKSLPPDIFLQSLFLFFSIIFYF